MGGGTGTGHTGKDVFEKIEEENAEALGISLEEYREMSIQEIEEELELEAREPYIPRGSESSYPILSSDRYETITEEELLERKQRVNEILYDTKDNYRETFHNLMTSTAEKINQVYRKIL